MALTYSELLKDPRWQKKRLEVMDRARWKCEDCGDAENTLNVHHRIYSRDAAPWEYPDENFVCCCDKCHQLREEVVKLSRIVFQTMPPAAARSLLFSMMESKATLGVLAMHLVLYVKLFNEKPTEERLPEIAEATHA